MPSKRDALMQSLANDVGNLKDHTNYTRWHSRLRRALKQQDPRYWPTLTGANKPSTIHQLSVPDVNVVREALVDKHDVSLKSITAGQIAEYINSTVHQPNDFLATWQAMDQKLLPLLLVTLGSHLHFHVRLAKTGSEAYRIIEGMFDGLAKQHVWANWINCTFSAYKTASDFVDRWRRSLAEVVYLFEDDAPSVRCQFCQFVVAVNGHSSAKSWARDAFFDMKDPPAMSIVYQSFLSRVGGREASGKAAKGLKVHWSM